MGLRSTYGLDVTCLLIHWLTLLFSIDSCSRYSSECVGVESFFARGPELGPGATFKPMWGAELS